MSLLSILAPEVSTIVKVVGSVVDRVVPDVNMAARLKDDLARGVADAAAKGDLSQLEINKTEAANPSMFVAGPRPGFMWLCVFTLGWTWIVAPFLSWTIVLLGAKGVPPLPVLGANEAQTALYGLLGLGAFRSADKIFAPSANQTKGVTIR